MTKTVEIQNGAKQSNAVKTEASENGKETSKLIVSVNGILTYRALKEIRNYLENEGLKYVFANNYCTLIVKADDKADFVKMAMIDISKRDIGVTVSFDIFDF